MGKYGNGISFGTVCTLERVEIRKALEGKVLDYYDNEGEPVYREGTKEEIEKVVISAYDALVYQAFQAMAAGRALERLYRENCTEPLNLAQYMLFQTEEEMKNNDYEYESDVSDFDTATIVEG